MLDYTKVREVFSNAGQGRSAIAEFRPGTVVNIWGLQPAFILGASQEYVGSVDLLWIDSIGVIVVMAYSLNQVREMVKIYGMTAR